MDATGYFATARERYRMRMRRLDGQQPPWTEDAVLQKFRFCNVHREHDKTTEWFRNEVRSKLSGYQVVQATLIFRWFNRIETGEIIKDLLLQPKWDTEAARTRLEGVQPVVTGAYMIRTEIGMSKLDGVLYAVEKGLHKLPKIVDGWAGQPLTIQQATLDLQGIYGIGPFLAYEITTDLRWTDVLNKASDILTWTNIGPGAAKGLGRLFGDEWRWNRGREDHQQEMVKVAQQLLEMSRNEPHWLQTWEPWEMREVEHWACEYQKWCQGQEGKNLKRRYR